MLLRALAFVILISVQAHAFIFDVNAFYFSDTFVPTAGQSTYVVTNYDLRIGFRVDTKERFYLGWSYSGSGTTLTQTAGSDVYTATEMGPSFLWALDKDKQWIISFAYNISSTATYTPAGGTSEIWKGPTLKAFIGYNFVITERVYFGPTLTYYMATYNEKIVGNTTYTAVANTRTQLYPALYFGLRF